MKQEAPGPTLSAQLQVQGRHHSLSLLDVLNSDDQNEDGKMVIIDIVD